MKFEKVSENKIRIILTVQDLAEKEIDFQAFMSNSIETQDILINMLEEAKKETGFDPENYNLRIEALAMADTNFIFTITKEIPKESQDDKQKFSKKKFLVRRKSLNPTSAQAVYAFSSFDDFCNFLRFIEESNLITNVSKLADSILLYEYKGNYYLLLDCIHSDVFNKSKLYAGITEFAKYVTNSKVFISKLSECGNLIMKNNALRIGIKHFCKK